MGRKSAKYIYGIDPSRDDRHREDDTKQLLTLAEEVDIPRDENVFINLSLHLAREQGLVHRRRGREPVWSGPILTAMIAQMARLTDKSGAAMGVAAASRELTGQELWGKLLEDSTDKDAKAKRIANRYYRHRSNKNPDLRRTSNGEYVYESYKRRGLLDAFDALINDILESELADS